MRDATERDAHQVMLTLISSCGISHPDHSQPLPCIDPPNGRHVLGTKPFITDSPGARWGRSQRRQLLWTLPQHLPENQQVSQAS